MRSNRIVGMLVAIVVLTIMSSMVAASLHVGPWKPHAVTPHRTSVSPVTSTIPSPSATSSTTSPSPSAVSTTSSPTASPSPSKAPEQQAIAPTSPVEVSIAGVLDVKIGGGIPLIHSADCREGIRGPPCLFPPEGNGAEQQAYYRSDIPGGLPSLPSTNTTYIVGHSYRYEASAAFNNLPATVNGDIVVVTTQTAVFRYRVYKQDDVPFQEMPDRSDVWAIVPNQLVLMTCALLEDKSPSINNHVVWATLISATPK